MDERLPARDRIIDAAIAAVRMRGYADTTVDEICAAAKVSKGSFFHHFRNKEDLARAAIDHWNRFTGAIFEQAPYQQDPDPLNRLLGYIDFRMAILDRPVEEFTCLLGTLVQEIYQTHPAIRTDCDDGMASHIALLMRDIEAAKAIYAPHADWDGGSIGYFIQSVLQGSFIFAKAQGDAAVVRSNLILLRRFIESLMSNPEHEEKRRRD
ncbi:TetR/AcrR family transcriptional regulator [Rhizobium alvei]|uniref:TetR/AcrR family transcriptional regulator n=1 Tax=Rhizobium alvei TaxID=1132659 RepID=A0ABT8YNW0_9HYPH|nr:TetR/AcrR family transcriptional regulator [Rhizobium alvei]MDO6965382.1 TetR/AcrR family transcriptional regulator [Rhizobium alvei]